MLHGLHWFAMVICYMKDDRGYYIAFLERTCKVCLSDNIFDDCFLRTLIASFIVFLSPRWSIGLLPFCLFSLCRISINSFNKPLPSCSRVSRSHIPHSPTFPGGNMIATPLSYTLFHSIFTPSSPRSLAESI